MSLLKLSENVSRWIIKWSKSFLFIPDWLLKWN